MEPDDGVRVGPDGEVEHERWEGPPADLGQRRTRRGPLDRELAAVLDRRPALALPVRPESIAEIRSAYRHSQFQLDRDEARARGVEIEERAIPLWDGYEALLVVLRPSRRTVSRTGMLFLHGGGLVAGDAYNGMDRTLDWVSELGILVASLDYRLAPEHPHPTPVEDCYAGLVWLAEHSQELGVDRWMLAGVTGGGNLAAALTLCARDRGGPPVAGAMLISPMLDDRNDTASSFELDGDAPWDRGSNLTAWRALLGDVAGNAVSEYAAPARAEDLTELPPTYLEVGAVSVLRDEVITYAQRLAEAGVMVELHLWAGAYLAFDMLAPDSQVAGAARATRLDYLRRAVSSLPG